MERMNEVRFIGNVGTLNAGEKHTYLAIAINESYKPKDKEEWVQKTAWIDVVAFHPTRDKITKQGIEVGDVVLIMGKLDSSEFEGKRKTSIIANKIQLIQKSKKNLEAAAAGDSGDTVVTNTPPNTTSAGPEPIAVAAQSTGSGNDDLPF